MATGPAHSSTIQPTPQDVINFLHLCRIILEDVPDILRWLFSQEILNKYKRQWVDGIKCGKWFLQQDRFTSKLSSTQKQNLANGQTQDWDSTLLFHTLLYSSHLLLADPIPGNKVSVQHNSKKLISTVPTIDFTRVLQQDDKIILDLGPTDFIRVEIVRLHPTELFLKWPLKLPQSAPVQSVCDAYVCSREWYAVEHLSFLRNDRFAHCKTACITNNELDGVIQDIEAVYNTLCVPPSRITKMKSIISEPIVEADIVQKIEYYKEKWLKESEHYVQVKEDIGHLQTGVKQIKEKDIPEIKDNLKEVKKESKEHQDKLDSLKSRQSTFEDKQSLQEQTLALHGTQLADYSEKIAQISSVVSTLHHQQDQTKVCIKQLSAEQNKQISEAKEKVDLSKQQKDWSQYWTSKEKPPSLDHKRGQTQNSKAQKMMWQSQPNNQSSQIFDKFYDNIVAVITEDKDLSHYFIETLYINFLFPDTVKKAVDQILCLDIKVRTVMRYLSTFMSRSRNPEKNLTKVIKILATFPKLKTLATDMNKEDLSKINIQIKSLDIPQDPQPKIKDVLETSSIVGADLDLLETSLTEPIKRYADVLRSTYKQWRHADTKWPQGFSSTTDMFVDLAIVENDPDYNDAFFRATIHGSVDDIIEKKKTPISLEDFCQLPCGSSILIEGAPGIGKSTLAFEICRRWSNGVAFQHHHLVLLLQLRDKTVQNSLTSIEKLLGCYLDKQSWKSQAVQDIIDESGSGMLIILEGYDELPDDMDGAYVVNKVIQQNLSKATTIITTRPSAKSKLAQIIRAFTHHIEVLGFTKANKDQYISKFFKDKESLQRFHQYIKRFPVIEGCLYVPINLVIVLDIFQHSHVDSSLPETMTELYDTLVRMLIYRHLKSHDPSKVINFSSLKELPQPALFTFHNLCKLAYDGICNKQLVFDCKENFETLGLMQKESQVLPSKGGDTFVYNFLHLTIQEFLAAYYVHDNNEEVKLLFRKCNYKFNLSIMMRFLAGLTKLESVNLYIPDKVSNCNIFHQFFEAKNDTLTFERFSRKKDVEVLRLSPTPIPSDMYMIGRCIALGLCQWKLGFTLQGFGSEHIEMFISGLNSTGSELKGCVVDASFSLNPLGNKGLNLLFELPQCILENIGSLYLQGIEVDGDCFKEGKKIPNFIKLWELLFHDNYFKEGEQMCFIETLCSWSKSLQHVSFSRLSSDECVTLTNLHTLHTIELYQLSSPSIKAVIGCLSKNTTLQILKICQSEIKSRFIDCLPVTLPSSRLKSLEFINCAIDSVTVCIIANAVKNLLLIEKLNLSDNLIDDKGGHYLADMIHSLTAAESFTNMAHNLNEVHLDHNPFTEETISRFVNVLSSCHPQSLIKLHLSLGWQDYIKSLPTYPEVMECVLFGRTNESQ